MYGMNLSIKRYTHDMNQALGSQSLPSIALNAVSRGVLFTVFIQLLTIASGLTPSAPAQLIMLAVIFSLFVFSVDLIEKYLAQRRLNRRP
jgi:hypothetical protein